MQFRWRSSAPIATKFTGSQIRAGPCLLDPPTISHSVSPNVAEAGAVVGFVPLPCVGDKLIKNLDSVVRNIDNENKALRRDLERESEERADSPPLAELRLAIDRFK